MAILKVVFSLCLIACTGGSYSCSKDWQTGLGTSCYMLLGGNFTWEEASLACRERGGHLVIITSELEQKYVQGFVARHQAKSLYPLRRFWLDGKDEESENHWYWDWTGNPMVYTNWYKGEPNNAGFNEDCLMIYTSGVWIDVRCNYKCHAICEKEEIDVNN